MNKLLSIITINYNNADGLLRTVESVLSQTEKDFEYIVIDGGSTDASKDILRKHETSFSYCISEKDAGIYNAMNKGWRKASGKYCLFLNSGDYLYDKNVIEKAIHVLENSKQEVVYGDLNIFDNTNSIIRRFGEPVSLYYFYYDFLPHPASFIQRALLEQLNGYRENYRVISDWIFFIEAFVAKATFAKVDLIVSAFNNLGISSGSNLNGLEKNEVLDNELSFLKRDFENFKRLRHYDTSILTRKAKDLSSLKMRLFK